jgi:hypothetical protein
MTSVLGNAVLAFLDHPEGGTLLDLRRFGGRKIPGGIPYRNQ